MKGGRLQNAFAFPVSMGNASSNSPANDGPASSSSQVSLLIPDEGGSPVRHRQELPAVVEENRATRPILRGTPGELPDSVMAKATVEDINLMKRRKEYFDAAFATREMDNPALKQLLQEAVVIADLKTNVIVEDEFKLLSSLCSQLSGCYQRPETSIVVNISHSACLLFGATLDPAYILTITAIPSQVQPTRNKRNAALIQQFMADTLRVPASRGIITFLAVSEGSLATNGRTLQSDMEVLEHSTTGKPSAFRRAISKPHRRRSGQATNTPRGRTRNVSQRLSPPPANSRSPPPPLPAIPTEQSAMDKKAEKVQRLGPRKSFLALFGRS